MVWRPKNRGVWSRLGLCAGFQVEAWGAGKRPQGAFLRGGARFYKVEMCKGNAPEVKI